MFDNREAIKVYRGWEALEKSLPKETRVEVIDFDLVPEIADVESFNSREEVLSRVLQLRSSVAVVDEITEFIWAKFNASAFYLQILLSVVLPEFYEHVRNMLGITPELISEETIVQQKKKVIELLSSFGVRMSNGELDKVSFAAFDDSIRVYKEEAEKEARENEARLLPAVRNLLGFSDLQIPHNKIRLRRVNRFWLGWSSGKKGDFLLQYNFHPRNRWRKGDMEYLTIHEVCGHFVHAASLAKEIERRDEGRLDPFIGITTVHDPQGFMGEGIADALTYFFPEEIPLSRYGVLSREQRVWRDYLNNNGHILINMGWDKQELMKYLLANPFTSTQTAERNLQTWQTHPLFRAYQYAYGIALKYHQRFAAKMNREQKVRYLHYAFTRYVTPRRLIEYAERLMEG